MLFLIGVANGIVIFIVIVVIVCCVSLGCSCFFSLVICISLLIFLGGLILEVGHMTWRGTSGGCSAYYFLTSWLLGLSNYLGNLLTRRMY